MKILFVDFDTKGHHGIYLKTLLGLASADSILVLPQKVEGYIENQYCIKNLGRNMNYNQYRKVLHEIKAITEKENPDIIHILSGDFLYRFFGLGLNILAGPVLVTFHHMIFTRIRCISYKQIFKKVDCGIVHTDYIRENLNNIGINNVSKIEYPCFEGVSIADKMILRDKYRIPKDRKVMLSFGGTRYDKGLDILLAALREVKSGFHLVIAGKAEDFGKEFIDEEIKDYRENVTYYLDYIEETKMEELFALCDIVILPYRRKFAGASGPLTTGVANGKMIIGPDYNSIGQIISKNHLGEVFDVEDVHSLEKVIEKALNVDFIYDEMALHYKEGITTEYFTDEYKELYKSRIRTFH